VLAAASLSGCGGAEPVSAAADGRVAITLDDFFISPQEVSADAGRITFAVTNRGEVGHTLRVLRGDKELAGVKTLLPGDSGTASGTFAKGRYDLVCILGNHRVLGMYGTLTVR